MPPILSLYNQEDQIGDANEMAPVNMMAVAEFIGPMNVD